jgi:hypothetical protein
MITIDDPGAALGGGKARTLSRIMLVFLTITKIADHLERITLALLKGSR